MTTQAYDAQAVIWRKYNKLYHEIASILILA